MSHANGLSPFRGKINGYLLPVDHFKRRDLKNISSPDEHKLTYKKEKIYEIWRAVPPEKKIGATDATPKKKNAAPDPPKKIGVPDPQKQKVGAAFIFEFTESSRH